jgi:hypothetical protein
LSAKCFCRKHLAKKLSTYLFRLIFPPFPFHYLFTAIFQHSWPLYKAHLSARDQIHNSLGSVISLLPSPLYMFFLLVEY